MPNETSCSVSPVAAGSAIRPPLICVRPICISPFRKVPFVRTTLFAWNSTPISVFTPHTVFPSSNSSRTVSCQIYRFGRFSSIPRQHSMKRARSLWERGLHIAGPLLWFSIRNWMAVRSVTIPIYPPKASISRTICPLAMPPTAGLQLICAILFMSIVMRSVFEPILAAAAAASQPAWPAPTTITS